MSNLESNLRRIQQTIPQECTLVAVSKTKPNSSILKCYEAGQLDFGENKVQELVQKAEELPKDIRWHMIGHLQRNKVKYIAPFVHLIHGVDSFRLLKEIDKRAASSERTIQCLLQIHIAEEATKFGFSRDELLNTLNDPEFKQLQNVTVVGLMGMATNTTDEAQIRKEFGKLKLLFDELADIHQDNETNIKMKTLSMGMSGDYHLAIEEGSNMVRVGSAIFGNRN